MKPDQDQCSNVGVGLCFAKRFCWSSDNSQPCIKDPEYHVTFLVFFLSTLWSALLLAVKCIAEFRVLKILQTRILSSNAQLSIFETVFRADKDSDSFGVLVIVI